MPKYIYRIVDKKREVKVGGTYALQFIGKISFLPPHRGKDYTTFKMKGERAQKNTPLVVIPNKWGVEDALTVKYIKNPEIGIMKVEKIPDDRERYGVLTYTYLYLFVPKPIIKPEKVDGVIFIVKGKGKQTIYTWGETPIKLPQGVSPLYQKTIVSKSATGAHWEEYSVFVYPCEVPTPQVRYFHGKKPPKEYWDFIFSS